MAKRKGKKRAVLPPKDVTRNGAVEDSLAQTQSLRPPRPRKVPRPSVEIVKIDSGEVERERQPRLRGALKGLDSNGVIPAAQPSVEIADEDDIDVLKSTQAVRHATRQARYGKSDANYDMKFHPMDVVTRPKTAAKRGSTSALPDEDAETDEESLPSSARGSDASSEDDDEESSDEEDDLAPREPDPKAMRHSKRAATSKTVNYSTKCHPQDYALPGRKRKARKFNKKQKNSHRLLSHVEISATRTDLVNLMTGDVDNVLNGDYLADAEPMTTKQRNRVKPQMSSPRKKLRTLADDRGKGSPYKISLQSTSTDTGSDIVHLLDMLTRTQTRGPPAADTPTPVSMAYPTSYEHEAITSKGETSSSVSIAGQDSDHQMAVDDKEPRKYSDEMEGIPGDDDEQWEDLPSSDDLALRGQDESFMFVDYGDSSDDFGSEMRRTMFMNQHAIDIQEHPSRHGPQETGTDMPPNASQRDMQHPTNNTPGEDSHSIDLDQQTEDQPLPSQFEEQFAVTESQANSFDDLTTAPRYENDLCSDLANVPKRDAITNNAHVIAAANSNETSDMPSTDRPELIPENKGIGSDTKGVECVSGDHDDLTLSHDDLPRSVRSSARVLIRW